MRILHVRNHEFNGKTLRSSPTAKGGMTIAYENNKHIVTIATAVVSEKDCYCKKTGRELAMQRFADGMTVMLPLPITSRRHVARYLRALFSRYID
jgi:hypothetical protein